MRNGIEAAEYASELQRVVRYIGVSNGNMQEGSLRCDVNVSVRPGGQQEFGTKVLFNLLNFDKENKSLEMLMGWIGVMYDGASASFNSYFI